MRTVDAVQAIRLHQALGALGEGESGVIVGRHLRKVGAVLSTASHREEHFELRILPFQFVQGVEATVGAVHLDLGIGILIGELSPRLERCLPWVEYMLHIDTSIRLDAGESVRAKTIRTSHPDLPRKRIEYVGHKA